MTLCWAVPLYLPSEVTHVTSCQAVLLYLPSEVTHVTSCQTSPCSKLGTATAFILLVIHQSLSQLLFT